MMTWLTQIVAVTELNLRTLKQRLGSAAVAVVGVAGVVAVFVAVLSIAAGFQATLANTGTPDTVVVMRGGSDTEMTSVLLREDTRIISDAPGILRNSDGPVASSELYVIVDLPKRSTGTVANVPLRGVQPSAFAVRGKVRVVEGRNFEPGRNEVIAGIGARREFEGLEIGSVLELGESRWTVVGVFSSDGTVAESELWCDASVLQPAYRRGNSFQSVYAKLTSPDAFEEFKEALTTDPRLNIKVMREAEYYADQSRQLNGIITGLGTLVTALMAVGAVFSSLNTMYSAVSARKREIATLRALGFGGSPVVISVLFESILLSLVGGMLGAGLAYLAFDGFRTATMNWQSFTQVAFAFAVTPALLVQGMVYSLLMGLMGGIFPAFRAARLPVVTALREL